jgi:WD40 repeat protein
MFRRLASAALLIVFFLASPLTHAQQNTATIPAWVNGFGSYHISRLSPDESTLVVSTTTGLYLYDTAQLTMPPLHLEGHTDTVPDAAFSPDGLLMATPSYDGTVRLWRVPSGETVWSTRLSEPCCASAFPFGVRFSDDGSLLLVVTGLQSPGPLFVINVRSGQALALESPFSPTPVEVRSSDILVVSSDNGAPVLRAIQANGDGFQQSDVFALNGVNAPPDADVNISDHYLLVSTGTSLVVAQLIDGFVVARIDNIPGWPSTYQDTLLAETEKSLTAVSLTAGARVDVVKQEGWYGGKAWAVYIDQTGTLTALNMTTLQSTPIAPKPTFYRQSGDYVLYLDPSGALRLVDLNGGTTSTLEGMTMPQDAQAISFTVYHQTALAAYGYAPFYVGLWDATTGGALVDLQTYDAGGRGFVWGITRAAITADRGGQNGILTADLQSPALQWVPVAGYAQPLLFSVHGLYYEPPTGGLALLDQASGQTTPLAFEGHTSVINDLAYSLDGTRIASASDDYTVRLWDAASGQMVDVVSMEASPQRLAFAGDTLFILADSQLYAWSGSLSSVGGYGVLNDITASGSALVAAGDQTVLVLDGSGSRLNLRRTLTPDAALPPVGYQAVAIDAGGKYVAAAGSIGSSGAQRTVVDVWNAANGAFIARLETPSSTWTRRELSFNADGSQLALTADATVVWNIDSLPGEPAYVTAMPYDSTNVFAGNMLAVSEAGNPTDSIDLYDANGNYMRTFQRNIHVSGGGGGVPRIPMATRADGSQIAVVDFPSALVAWNLPLDTAFTPQLPPMTVIAYCDKLDGTPTDISANDPITLVWSWYATEIPLVLDHLYSVNYDITLDGQSLSAFEARRSTIRRDSANDNNWTVYYTLDVGQLAPGEHTITYGATWDREISDGLEKYGPGTAHPEDTGSCRFTIQ